MRLPVFVLAWIFQAFAIQDRLPEDPYTLLKNIPSFYSLFSQKGLNAYSADAVVEGAIYESLRDMAKQKNLSEPRFIEIYKADKGFTFKLKNRDYPAYFKQIVDELFTPVRAFDQVISAIESKREFSWFNTFKTNTTVEASWVQYNDTPHIKMIFTPRPGATMEKFIDSAGGQPRLTETTAMTFIIHPDGKLLKMMKVTQQEKTGDKDTTIEKKFTFEYARISGHTMPVELIIEKNGKNEIKFKATYITKGSFIVFSEKFFGYKDQDGNTGKVRINYQDYNFNNQADLSYVDEAKSKIMLEQEAAAEKLFNEAKELIMDGKNSKSMKILQKIVKNYPETTYAKQAQTLLNGLPE